MIFHIFILARSRFFSFIYKVDIKLIWIIITAYSHIILLQKTCTRNYGDQDKYFS